MSARKFIVRIRCAPFARKTSSNPDISSALIFLAASVECCALTPAVGGWREGNF